jgi:hypothetical protein
MQRRRCAAGFPLARLNGQSAGSTTPESSQNTRSYRYSTTWCDGTSTSTCCSWQPVTPPVTPATTHLLSEHTQGVQVVATPTSQVQVLPVPGPQSDTCRCGPNTSQTPGTSAGAAAAGSILMCTCVLSKPRSDAPHTGGDSQLRAASPSSIPQPDTAQGCAQAILLPTIAAFQAADQRHDAPAVPTPDQKDPGCPTLLVAACCFHTPPTRYAWYNPTVLAAEGSSGEAMSTIARAAVCTVHTTSPACRWQQRAAPPTHIHPPGLLPPD